MLRFLPVTSSYSISPETLRSPVIVVSPSTYNATLDLAVVAIPTFLPVQTPTELEAHVPPAPALVNLKFLPAS